VDERRAASRLGIDHILRLMHPAVLVVVVRGSDAAAVRRIARHVARTLGVPERLPLAEGAVIAVGAGTLEAMVDEGVAHGDVGADAVVLAGA
jgi:hypothetical protein